MKNLTWPNPEQQKVLACGKRQRTHLRCHEQWLRTKEDQPHQSLRIQVHQRASQVDKDGKALSAEYLHGQQIISEPFCIH